MNMGIIFNFMVSRSHSLGIFSTLVVLVSFAAERNPEPPKLEDAFSDAISEDDSVDPQNEYEIEPTVVGRENWTEQADEKKEITTESGNSNVEAEKVGVPIDQLDAIETKEAKPDSITLPIEPPSPPPAVNIHRNFEGILVLKPRKLGMENVFPFQLENSSGRRLAFVDTEGLRTVDPVAFTDKRVNLLGKLEPLEEGSKDLVIRARLLRPID